MSYARVDSTGNYIYHDYKGYVDFNGKKISDNEIDIFLYRITTNSPSELNERINHGKELIDKWMEERVEFETR